MRLDRGHPLVDAGQKLLPSITRVFSASRGMYVYLEAYQQYATALQPLVAFATFYQDGEKMFRRPVHCQWPCTERDLAAEFDALGWQIRPTT